MKVTIVSDKPVQKCYLQSLDYKKHNFPLGKDFELAQGWYELRIEYVDTKIDIQDIKINDFSIGYMIYTGFYTDGAGEIHSPGNAVWDIGGLRLHGR